MSEPLTIIRPDDFHVHLRQENALRVVAPYTARQFARALIMPNCTPPITTTQQAQEYRQQILGCVGDHSFEPLMTLYLTDQTTSDEIMQASDSGIVFAAKLYPRGATTNSETGVTDILGLYPVLETMEECDLVLSVHGEVTLTTHPNADVFDFERIFIEQVLQPIINRFSHLRVVLEHITTQDAVDFVLSSSPHVAATITPQHLMYNRNDLLVGGLHPHRYCLPIVKAATPHQSALRSVITLDSPKFFLGTDSAPHARTAKESACGCAGCFSAPCALELYAQVFEECNALHLLEAFASRRGAHFYGLPLNAGTVTLLKKPRCVPRSIPYGESGELIPFCAGEELAWRLES
ncbi:MAG: dihydroorotase [Candidatus Kerfeldbacteria bacterium]|nr:dihydroorotase [Candidatus Kerfeldbacteria bacterium]